MRQYPLGKKWNGDYFVTLIHPNGNVLRQNAALPVPDGCTIAATDNGMQSLEETHEMIERIKRELAEGRS